MIEVFECGFASEIISSSQSKHNLEILRVKIARFCLALSEEKEAELIVYILINGVFY